MADLIDRAALLEWFDRKQNGWELVFGARSGKTLHQGIRIGILHSKNAVLKAPAVDAVEVVRCKECEHWTPGKAMGGDSLDDMQIIGRCPLSNFMRREKDFCSFGERKET